MKKSLLIVISSLTCACATFNNSSSKNVGYSSILGSCKLLLNAKKNVRNSHLVDKNYLNYQEYLAVLLGQSDATKSIVMRSQNDYINQAKILNCGLVKEPEYCYKTYMIYVESFQKEKEIMSRYNIDSYMQGFNKGLNECQKSINL